jgi:1,4-dihydroxy-2-naphthoate octaprenyltransferase
VNTTNNKTLICKIGDTFDILDWGCHFTFMWAKIVWFVVVVVVLNCSLKTSVSMVQQTTQVMQQSKQPDIRNMGKNIQKGLQELGWGYNGRNKERR